MRKIEKKIMASFSVLSITFLTMTIINVIQINKVTQSSRYIQHTLEPSIRTNLILAKAVNDSLFSLQNYFIYKDHKYLRQRDAHWSVIDKQNKQLVNYSKNWTKPEQLEKLTLFQNHLAQYKSEQENVLAEYHSYTKAALLKKLNEISNNYRVATIAHLRMISDPQTWEMERVFLLEEKHEEKMKSTTAAFLVLGLLSGLIIVIILRRAVILPLHRTMKVAEGIAQGDYTLNKSFSGEENLDNALKIMLDRLNEKQKENNNQKQMLQSYNDRLKASNEELSQFSYRTSHDLKAPLVTVRRLANLIYDDIKDGEYVEAQQNSAKIESHVYKLENLVVDILDLAQAELKGEQFESIDFEELIKEVEEKLSLIYLENTIRIEVCSSEKINLFSSKIRIIQILENLISNSIKYQDKEKTDRYIKVSLAKNDKGSNTIIVEDNGVGIPAQYQSKVFEMFQRFHPSISYGSGLGLYIIKKHVEKLNGKIKIISTKQSTKFVITLPE